MTSNKNFDVNIQLLISTMNNLLNCIKNDKDPHELNIYRHYFKKKTPFFLRSYMAAYLLRDLVQSGDEVTHQRPEATITLFVNIGKNRQVFPRDLAKLFTTIGQVSKNNIGEIKVLDNYSFVEIEEKLASTMIERMNGFPYRGRCLVINYAKRRAPQELSAQKDSFYQDNASLDSYFKVATNEESKKQSEV